VALVFFGKISRVVRFWQTLYQAQTLHDLFHLPLSIEAFQQFQTLGMQLDALQWEEASDIWVYIWNSNVFSSQKAYVHLIDHRQVHGAYTCLSKACSQNKRKVFF